MQARLTAYPPDNAAVVRIIGTDAALQVGRAGECALRLQHPSVSRIHALIRNEGAAWHLRDLDSKNGSFVDGAPVTSAVLEHDCWLRFGDVFCEFSPMSNAQADASRVDAQARRAAATAHTARIDGVQLLDDLLDASLRGVLDLTQCDRGFVLLHQSDGYHVRASIALDPARMTTQAFSGSVGAVRRALESRHSVVVNEVRQEAWLASRASVVAGGLSALVCLPMLDGESVLGAIYVDRTRPGPAISTLDLELLEAFVERAALWIAARRASQGLDEPVTTSAQWNGIVAAHAGAVDVDATTGSRA
jgi:hypothetical protein